MVTSDISKSVALAAIICLQRACAVSGRGEMEGEVVMMQARCHGNFFSPDFVTPPLKTNSGGIRQRGQSVRKEEGGYRRGGGSSYRPAGLAREMKNVFSDHWWRFKLSRKPIALVVSNGSF